MFEQERYKYVLDYILQNCIVAYDELCTVNKKLNKGMCPDSDVDVNHLGAMDRMIKDYLIIRVGGLFDKTTYPRKGEVDEVVSCEKILSTNETYKSMGDKKIIKYIINKRHNFVAHTNKNFDVPKSSKICDSDLREILLKLKDLVS